MTEHAGRNPLPFFSFGVGAHGTIAIGVGAHGVLALGCMAVGVVAIGVNVVASAVAIGVNAVGPVAIGVNAIGPVAVGFANADGVVSTNRAFADATGPRDWLRPGFFVGLAVGVVILALSSIASRRRAPATYPSLFERFGLLPNGTPSAIALTKIEVVSDREARLTAAGETVTAELGPLLDRTLLSISSFGQTFAHVLREERHDMGNAEAITFRAAPPTESRYVLVSLAPVPARILALGPAHLVAAVFLAVDDRGGRDHLRANGALVTLSLSSKVGAALALGTALGVGIGIGIGTHAARGASIIPLTDPTTCHDSALSWGPTSVHLTNGTGLDLDHCNASLRAVDITAPVALHAATNSQVTVNGGHFGRMVVDGASHVTVQGADIAELTVTGGGVVTLDHSHVGICRVSGASLTLSSTSTANVALQNGSSLTARLATMSALDLGDGTTADLYRTDVMGDLNIWQNSKFTAHESTFTGSHHLGSPAVIVGVPALEAEESELMFQDRWSPAACTDVVPCYESAGASDGQLDGKLSISVDAGGHATGAVVYDGNAPLAARACIESRGRARTLPGFPGPASHLTCAWHGDLHNGGWRNRNRYAQWATVTRD